jgi:signal transduction histidine kinase
MDFREDFSHLRALWANEPHLGVEQSLLACYQEALGHLLPNNLVALQGLARLLQEGEAEHLEPEGRTYLARLASLARQTDDTVRALAVVGRLCRDARAGSPVDCAEVAREAVAEVSLLYAGRPVTYDFPEALPLVAASRQSLHQALVQLLRNAAGAGGQSVRIAGRRATGGVAISVEDDGKGLPPLPPERLFAPLQAPADGRPGLGLFLVRQMVACWGGGLRVQSEVGRGACFTLLVPTVDAPTSQDMLS